MRIRDSYSHWTSASPYVIQVRLFLMDCLLNKTPVRALSPVSTWGDTLSPIQVSEALMEGFIGLSGETRTHDPVVPGHVRYLTALHPDMVGHPGVEPGVSSSPAVYKTAALTDELMPHIMSSFSLTQDCRIRSDTYLPHRGIHHLQFRLRSTYCR